MKRYKKVKEWIELLNSIETGNNFKEIIKRGNPYLEPIFSSPVEKSMVSNLTVYYLTKIPISHLPSSYWSSDLTTLLFKILFTTWMESGKKKKKVLFCV